jgi:hypothetical protein
MEVPSQYPKASGLTRLYEMYAWAGDYPALPQPDTVHNMRTDLMVLGNSALEPWVDPAEHLVDTAAYFVAGMAQLERAEVATAYEGGHPYAPHAQEERDVAEHVLRDMRSTFVYDHEGWLRRLLGSVGTTSPQNVDVARIGLAVDVVLERDDEFTLMPPNARHLEGYGEGVRLLAKDALRHMVLKTFPKEFTLDGGNDVRKQPLTLIGTALPVIAEAERLRSFPPEMPTPYIAFQMHRARRLVRALERMERGDRGYLPSITRGVCRFAIEASGLSYRRQWQLMRKVGK